MSFATNPERVGRSGLSQARGDCDLWSSAGTTAMNQPVPTVSIGIMSAKPPLPFSTTAVPIQIAAQTSAALHK